MTILGKINFATSNIPTFTDKPNWLALLTADATSTGLKGTTAEGVTVEVVAIFDGAISSSGSITGDNFGFPKETLEAWWSITTTPGKQIKYGGFTPGESIKFSYMCPKSQVGRDTDVSDGTQTVRYVQIGGVPQVPPPPVEIISIADAQGFITHTYSLVSVNANLNAVIIETTQPVLSGGPIQEGASTMTLAGASVAPTAVTVGGVAATGIGFTSPALTFTAPLLPDGTYDVVVTLAPADGGGTATATGVTYTNSFPFSTIPGPVDSNSIWVDAPTGIVQKLGTEVVEIKVVEDFNPNILVVDWVTVNAEGRWGNSLESISIQTVEFIGTDSAIFDLLFTDGTTFQYRLDVVIPNSGTATHQADSATHSSTGTVGTSGITGSISTQSIAAISSSTGVRTSFANTPIIAGELLATSSINAIRSSVGNLVNISQPVTHSSVGSINNIITGTSSVQALVVTNDIIGLRSSIGILLHQAVTAETSSTGSKVILGTMINTSQIATHNSTGSINNIITGTSSVQASGSISSTAGLRSSIGLTSHQSDAATTTATGSIGNNIGGVVNTQAQVSTVTITGIRSSIGIANNQSVTSASNVVAIRSGIVIGLHNSDTATSSATGIVSGLTITGTSNSQANPVTHMGIIQRVVSGTAIHNSFSPTHSANGVLKPVILGTVNTQSGFSNSQLIGIKSMIGMINAQAAQPTCSGTGRRIIMITSSHMAVQATSKATNVIFNVPTSSNVLTFFLDHGATSIQFNEAAIEYYKSVGATSNQFNTALKEAQNIVGFKGLSPLGG